MTSVLALDLATTTGWAHSDGSSGVAVHKLRTGDSPGVRFLLFRKWLADTLDAHPASLIVYEQAAGAFRSLAATHVIHGFIAHVEAVASERVVDVTSRSSATVKKWALGDVPLRDRNKARMVQLVENVWGLDVLTHDHADAVVLLWGTMSELGVVGTPWHTPEAARDFCLKLGQTKKTSRRSRRRP